MNALRGISEGVRSAGERTRCHRCGTRVLSSDGVRSPHSMIAQVGTGERTGPRGPYKATLGIVRVLCAECVDEFNAWWGSP